MGEPQDRTIPCALCGGTGRLPITGGRIAFLMKAELPEWQDRQAANEFAVESAVVDQLMRFHDVDSRRRIVRYLAARFD